MNRVSDVMTRDVHTLSPADTLQRAAQLMDELDVGVVPVCDGDELMGVVTDRDITVRGVALNRPANTTPLSEVMSMHAHCCYEDQTVGEVMQQMQDAQIRRLPVIDRAKRLVGIVSLGDLAVRPGTPDAELAETLAVISDPEVVQPTH